ncbi:isopeptide-forming domain-containing fimbrial protein [Bifidobacterium sp. ESL0790]|uniref:isopeptide-forming domain-containing fimbrial protein n=1 Tax=Bifidobacterium sp. ESL0790 TaxID=2983233 RepID=UPI0023F844CE|nr:isopeptide-forming domain-containing fimbrial protein [Bifidobacterium sp. ESL0790]WEV72888.1 isopeptide-forming domain-containing fimbrial protein [Bifidobacterium sp. ESL0790]
MNVTTGLKRGVGGLAAAAVMLALAMVPSGSAMADQVNVNTSATSTLTINGTNKTMIGHHFKAIQLAAYQNAQANAGGKLTSVSVSSTGDLETALKAAYKVANGGVDIDSSKGTNVMAQVATQWLGFPSSSSSNEDETSIIPGTGWHGANGQLRDFVTSLMNQTDIQSKINSSSYTAAGPTSGTPDSTPATATFTNLPIGLYLMVDDTAGTNPVSGTSAPAAIPMLAGTTLWSTAPTEYTYFSEDADEALPLGQVDMKTNVPTIKKKLVAPANGSASIGDQVTYQLIGSVPLTTGYTHYTYKLTDVPGAGLTYVPNTVSVQIVTNEGDTTPVATIPTANYTVTTPSTPPADGEEVVFNLSPAMVSIGSNYYGKYIRVQYNMKLNNNATHTNIGNGFKLAYSNDPGHQPSNDNGDDTGGNGTVTIIDQTSPGEQIPTYYYNFQMEVQAKIDSSTKLSGAVFEIIDPTTGNPMKFRKLGDGNYKKVDIDTPAAPDIFTSVVSATGGLGGPNDLAQGQIKIDGVGANTYTVNELTVPTGYGQAFASSFTVHIDVASPNSLTQPEYSNSYDVWHLVTEATWPYGDADTHFIPVQEVTSFAQLPITGGAGAIVVALAVVALLGGAGAIYIYTRRSEKSLSQEA